MTRIAVTLAVFGLAFLPPSPVMAQRGGPNAADSIKYKYPSSPKLEALKAEAAKEIDAKAKMIQEMVDQVFSFGELGMQEVETSRYLSGLSSRTASRSSAVSRGFPPRSSRDGARASR